MCLNLVKASVNCWDSDGQVRRATHIVAPKTSLICKFSCLLALPPTSLEWLPLSSVSPSLPSIGDSFQTNTHTQEINDCRLPQQECSYFLGLFHLSRDTKEKVLFGAGLELLFETWAPLYTNSGKQQFGSRNSSQYLVFTKIIFGVLHGKGF